MAIKRKIINDPVYGFITLDHPVLLQVIDHPLYQRLRNIHQMAFAYLVYPGAVHSRLHHSLGAYHLMCQALYELKGKGISITEHEELAAKLAILLHDIGHGPFSHALENEVMQNIHHEDISLLLMQRMNSDLNGALDMAIDIFTDKHPKKFLHQLVSGQLDVDRMDYLIRDSFFSGVAEGVIGYDRILKMLMVHDGNLVVEEKGIYSVEKFLVSRRLMYWQVYLHKTVLGAEKLLVNIVRRARQVIQEGKICKAATPYVDFILKNKVTQHDIDVFCNLDDHDMLATIKMWAQHEDAILRTLCAMLVNRRLLKVVLQGTPFTEQEIFHKKLDVMSTTGLSNDEANFFVLSGEASITTYNLYDEHINILYKDGTIKDISQVDNALIHAHLNAPARKYFLCYPKEINNYLHLPLNL